MPGLAKYDLYVVSQLLRDTLYKLIELVLYIKIACYLDIYKLAKSQNNACMPIIRITPTFSTSSQQTRIKHPQNVYLCTLYRVSSLNMAVKRHNKDRLWSLKYFAGFLPRPTFTSIILETIWSQNSCMSCHFQYVVGPLFAGREGTPGRHEPPLCRHEPPRFARQTEPPIYKPSICYADQTSAMQNLPPLSSKRVSMHYTAQLS